MARKDYRQATGALGLSVPWFRLVAGLWLLSMTALGFVSFVSSLSGLKQWVAEGSIHGAIFLALALVPGLYVRSISTLAAAALVTLSLAVGLETAQAAYNDVPLERVDIIANLLGFAAGIVLAAIVRRKVHGALGLSMPRFRLVAGLWLLSIALLGFVSFDSSFLSIKQWIVDGAMHGAIFLAVAFVPGFCFRSMSTLVFAALVTLGLAVGLEAAQAAHNDAPLERADILANLLGFAAGMVLVILARRKVRRLPIGAGRLARQGRSEFMQPILGEKRRGRGHRDR